MISPRSSITSSLHAGAATSTEVRVEPGEVSSPDHGDSRLWESVSAVLALSDAIEGGEIAGVERNLDRAHVLLEVRDRSSARDQQHPVVAGKQPRQRDLDRRGA